MSKSSIDQNINKHVDYDFSCLIEREDVLFKVQAFLDMLILEKRGIFRVVGNPGTGRTRLLNEIAQKSVACGFELGFINDEQKVGTSNTDNKWLAIDPQKVDISNFLDDIVDRVEKNKKNGFILIADDAMGLDNAALSFVRQVLTSEIPVNLGLVYSIEPENVFSLDYIDIELCNTAYINALSPKGVELWIKSVLSWEEAPKAFLKWLYSETKGLPKLIREYISYLIQNGILVRDSDSSWTIAGDFGDMDTINKNGKADEKDKDKLPVVKMESFDEELRLTSSMGQFWHMWEYWTESLTRLKEMLKRQEAVPKLENVRLFKWLGRLINLDGDHEQAIAVLNDGLELFRKSGNKEGEAEILYMKALALSIPGNSIKVAMLLQESLALYRLIDNKHGIICALQYLGLVYYYQGEYEKAELCSVESLEICRKLKDKLGISRSLVRTGMVAKGKGNFTLAMKMFNEHLEISEEIDDKEGIYNALINMAQMSRTQQNYSFARDYYVKCLKLVREMGYKSLIARALKELGDMAMYEEEFDKASQLFQESLDILRESGDEGEIMWQYRNMAELEIRRQCYSAAKELCLKGLRTFRDSKQDILIYPLLVFDSLAEIALLQDEFERAGRLIGAADRLFEVAGKLIEKYDLAQFHMRQLNIQNKMSKEQFNAAWSEGNSMSFELALDYAMEEKGHKIDIDMAEKMLNYIKANYSNDISLTDISEHFGMSPCYLSTMFKHYTGENFKDYLNFYRVKKAKEHLKNGKMKMGAVAKMVGCNSINTFIRIFKKYEGVSPGQYVEKR